MLESGDNEMRCRDTPSRSNRVVRGGSWNNNARNCRAAYRNRRRPGNRNRNQGFRVCLISGTKSIRSSERKRTTRVPFCMLWDGLPTTHSRWKNP
ncbi:MAG: SUMF1/EgtB/PvdO family nonheme iron enzyme [Planctomycetota bacterium]